MKKLLFHVSKKLLIVSAIAMVSIVSYTKWKEPTVVYQETTTTQALKGSVYVSDMAFEQARQVGKFFGYENMWRYRYKLDQSPTFVQKSTDENWFSDSAKSFGQLLLGKEYDIDLNNYFMLGYDFSALQKEDVRYIEESKTLVIQLPPLELSYTPDYAATEFNSSIGLFRLNFSDEDKQKMYQDSIETGLASFINETEEIEKGALFTQEAIKQFLLSNELVTAHIKDILFKQVTDEIVTSIETYKTKTQPSQN